MRPHVAGLVFLQSDIEEAARAMRNAFEECAADAFQLAPQHTTQPVFFTDCRQDGHGIVQDMQDETSTSTSTSSNSSTSSSMTSSRLSDVGLSGADSADTASRSMHSSCQVLDSDPRHTNGHGQDSINQTHMPGAWQTNPDPDNTADGHDGKLPNTMQRDQPFVSVWAKGGWLSENPVGVPTEREHYVGESGGTVYRVLLVRK